jgi:hypothetical protein
MLLQTTAAAVIWLARVGQNPFRATGTQPRLPFGASISFAPPPHQFDFPGHFGKAQTRNFESQFCVSSWNSPCVPKTLLELMT